jgi:hypothetical protein
MFMHNNMNRTNNKMRERPVEPFSREIWLQRQRALTAEQRVLTPLGDIRKVASSEYRSKWRGDFLALSGQDNLGQFQGKSKLVVGEFKHQEDRRGNKRYFLGEEQVNAFHDSMISWLRHETPGKTDVPHRPFHVDDLGRVKLEELTTLFFHEFKNAINDGIIMEHGAWLLIHIMAWFPSKYIFWCN